MAVAKREVINFKGQKKKANRFSSLKTVAQLYRDHTETKAQYDEVVKEIKSEDFKQWLDVNSSKTFEQVKQDAALMVRAADYAKAYAQKEELVQKGQTPQMLLQILKIKIDNPSDCKEFKKRSFDVHKATMLPENERHFTIEQFLQTYSK